MALGKAQVAQHRGNIDYFLLVALFQNWQEGDGEEYLSSKFNLKL
jgi:hypothetical protein